MIKLKKKYMGEAYGTYGENTGAYRVVVRKPEGKRPRGKPRHSWEDNIRLGFKETGWEGVDWIDLAQ
jgi:hypothetical protein